jgi:hypothetical protein
MAIRINIGTVFDNKGLAIAKKELRTLSASVDSLARNFAIAGAAIGGVAIGLSKAVMSASNFEAEFEGVNQVFKEAAGSVQAFAEQAAKSAGLSATEALQASKTFGLFATGAGLGVKEAAKFSTTLVQLAGDLGSFNDVPTAEALSAIQSGLMGSAEPLRKFGVFLTDDALRAEALALKIYEGSGALSAQQKMLASYSLIIQETGIQQGDFVKYQETLGNQLKIVGAEFSNLTRDIGMLLIPVITEAMPQIRELALTLGQQLKVAIEAIDWETLIQSVVDFTKFIVNNATTIANLVIGLFALNTAFKLVTVAMAFGKVAMTIYTGIQTAYTTGTSLATIATTLLGNAMRLIPFVAIAGGIALVINGVMNLGNEAGKSTNLVVGMDGAVRAAGNSAQRSVGQFEMAAHGIRRVSAEVDMLNEAIDKPKDSESRNRRHALREANRAAGLIGSGYSTILSSIPDVSSLLNGAAIIGASAGASDDSFAKELERLQKEAEKAAKEAEKAMNEIERKAAREAEKAAKEAANALRQVDNAALDEKNKAAAAEKAILDKRLNAFESFNNSVKNLFGQIKESILSSFNLPTLGNSVNSITRNIGKLLEKTKGFAKDITRLSGLGLNSDLLQQVIEAGPVAGSRLASALVGGGSSFIKQLNLAYSEMGGLASGIAGVGTRSEFANRQVVNTYNIEVNGGVGSGPTIGKAIVDAIKSYERTSGAVWQGA